MTVAELINALREYNPSSRVLVSNGNQMNEDELMVRRVVALVPDPQGAVLLEG